MVMATHQIRASNVPVRQVTSAIEDCNDGSSFFNPNTTWYKDTDNDGYSDGTTKAQCSQPSGYRLASDLVAVSGDCSDGDASLHPATVWYKDADNDGYSDGVTKAQCSRPTGYKLAGELTATSGDCNDNDQKERPDAVWYKDADNDGYSDGATISQCSRPEGYKSYEELSANSSTADPPTPEASLRFESGHYYQRFDELLAWPTPRSPARPWEATW